MSTGTSIEWTDTTWNPIRARRLDDGKSGWHCERVSAGCARCYASTFNGRRLPHGGTGLDYARPSRDRVETYLDEEALAAPLRWRKPRRVFLSSMTDVFGEWVSDDQLDRLFAIMALAPLHTFQVLTKRPERMRAYFADRRERVLSAIPATETTQWRVWAACTALHVSGATQLVEPWSWGPGDSIDGPWPLPNVWLGVSVEDQASADARIPVLLDTPAAKRFLSCEPLLGPVNLGRVAQRRTDAGIGMESWERLDAVNGSRFKQTWGGPWIWNGLRGPRADWVIVGGESGPGARPCDVAWIRSIVQQCKAAGVAAFVKQLGAVPIEGVGRAPLSTISRDRRGTVDGAIADDGGEAQTWDRIPLVSRKGNDPAEWPDDLRVRELQNP